MLRQRGIAKSLVDDARSVLNCRKFDWKKRKNLCATRRYLRLDAYVARRYVDNFVNVSVNQKIVRLNDLHRLLVVASVPEALAATGNQEQVLDMYAVFDFLPDERFTLTLAEIRGEADTVAQTYETAMIMERPSQWNILPGMTAGVIVEMQALRIALGVPAAKYAGGRCSGRIPRVGVRRRYARAGTSACVGRSTSGPRRPGAGRCT